MAPTIQAGQAADRERRGPRSGPSEQRRSDFVCRVKYCNTLPDIPFDPKFITYPFESTRFVRYNATSLERNFKHDLLTEHDLGVTIDLINPDAYAVDPHAHLDGADEKLLEEDIATPQNSKRSQHHAKSVSWLRRTEYISTEYTAFKLNDTKHETKVGYNMKKKFGTQDVYLDRETQIEIIEKTFEDIKTPITKHYSKGKPSVVPVEVMDLFPDFDLWKFPCAQVIFDSDPSAGVLKTSAKPAEEMSQAMIRGVQDESGEQFVAYFLPTEETIMKWKKDKEDGVDYRDDETYDFKIAREYNWNVKNKTSKGYEENYFFVFRNGGAYYNELETRVRLSKRRVKQGCQSQNSRLMVKHRPLLALESKIQEKRMQQLEAPQDEEEGGNKSGSDNEEFHSPAAGSGSEDEGSPKKRTRKISGSDASGSEDEGANKGSGSEKGAGSDNESDRGSKRRRRSGSAGSNRSGSPASKHSGSPGSRHSGSPASRRSGSPDSRHSGSPASRHSGSPGSHHSGSPSSRHSGSPASRRSASPQSHKGSGSDDDRRSNRSRSGSPAGSASGASVSSSRKRKSSSSGSSSSEDEAPSPKKVNADDIFGSDSD